jgi:outer membrane protein TolC
MKSETIYQTIVIVVALWVYSVSARSAETLSLDSYLHQVQGGNQNLKAAEESTQGANLRTAEAKLIFTPTLFAEAQQINDHELNALFPGAYRKVRIDTYTLGLMQQTPFGTHVSLAYTLNNADYVGAQNRFWEGAPRLEISQSLWRNFFGSESRAQKQLVEAGSLAAQYGQSFQVKATLAEAESAYIRLAAARDLVRVFKASFAQANELMQWSGRRSKLNLSENSDLFQAQANYEARNLNLQSAIDEERSAARSFNRMRNLDSDVVQEAIVLPEIKSIAVPERALIRDDVRAAQEGTRIASAQAQLGADRNRPTLEVYASRRLNSRAGTRIEAMEQSFNSNLPTTTIGLKFQTPLLLGHSFNAIDGYKKERIAAETLSTQKIFEQEIEWKDLVQKLGEAKKRYEIAEKLVAISKKKSENERNQLKRGRSTTYQTLIFDQDLNSAEASRIQSQSEVLGILARMKTFGGH